MKKMKGIFSLLLAAVLLISAVPAGNTAYADEPVLSIMNFVHEGEDYGQPIDNTETTDVDESVIVSVLGSDDADVSDKAVVTLRQGIKIIPAEGYVIEDVLFIKAETANIGEILAQPDVLPEGQEAPEIRKNSAISFATASKADASISFKSEDIITGTGEDEKLKAELFTGSLTAADNCAIVVALKAIREDDLYTVNYATGELDVGADFVDQQSVSVPAGKYTAKSISDAAKKSAYFQNKSFSKWQLSYENGMTGFDVAANEEIFLSGSASLTAVWVDYVPETLDLTVTAQDPVFNPASGEYEREGSGVELSAAPAVGDRFNGLTVEVQNEGGATVTVTPSALQVVMDNNSDPAEPSKNIYNINYVPKTYNKPTLTITADNPAEDAAASSGSVTTGYTVSTEEGNKLLEGDTIQSLTMTVTPDDSKVVATPSAAVIMDGNNNNVTNKYYITYVSGETQKQTPPSITVKNITVTAKPPVFDAESNSYKADGYVLSGDDIDAAHTFNENALAYSVSEVSADGKIKVTPSLKEGGKLLTLTADGSDVTATHYNVSYAASEDYTLPALTITAVNPAESATGSKENAVSGTDYVLSGTLGENESIAVTITYDTSDESKVLSKTSAVITDANGKTVTNKYKITYVDGQTAKTPVTTVKLTIKAKDRSAEYSGEVITANDYEIKSGKLNDGDEITEVLYDGGSKKVTTTAVESMPYKVTVMNGSTDVTADYEFEYEAGKVTVTKYSGEVTITAADAEKVYDGTALTKNEVTATGLRKGDIVIASAEGSATIPSDTGANKVVAEGANKWVIKNADGEDVSDCYAKVTLVDGKLTVKKRPATITAKDKTTTYNGNAVQLQGSDIGYDNFVLDHVPNVSVKIMQKGQQVASAVESGSYTIEISSYTVKDENGKGKDADANGNKYNDFYDITVTDGTLLIKPSAESVVLTVTAPSQTWTYDGTAHTSQALKDIKIEGLMDGDTVTEVKFTSTSKITNAGKVANIIDTVVIKDKDGKAVSNSKYVVNRKAGELVVNKFPITVTAKSATKDYDGTSSTNNKDVVVPQKLANSNHKVTSARVTFLDSSGKVVEPVNAGTYTKKVTEVTIKDGSTDVTSNYDITYVDGTLTINAKSGTTTGTGTGGGVKTGDESNLTVWIVLLAVSALVAGAVLIILIKKTRKAPQGDMPEAEEIPGETEEKAEEEIVIDQSVFDDEDK